MKAIEYVVRNGAGFLQRGTLIESGISDNLTLGADGAVSLNIGRSGVREYLRAGENLEIYLLDGRKIVLEGFFSEDGVQENKLYLNEDGALIEASMAPSGHMTFSEAAEWGKWSHLDPMIFPDEATVVADVATNEVATQGVGLGLLGLGGGGLGLAPLVGGAGVIGTLVGGGDGDSGVKATVDDADATHRIGGDDDHQITITGTAEPESEVLIIVGDEELTVTSDEDGRWTGTFDGDDFPADGDYAVAVQVTEPDGQVIDLTGPAIQIDTVAPELDITSGTDDVVNGVAHEGGVTISGTGEAGASIAVEIDGTTHTTTVSEGGTWSVTFDSSEVTAGERSTTVTVTSTDGFGNSTVVTETLEIDTIAPDLNIGDTQVGDNIVNETEAAAGFDLTGTAEAGATITVTIDGQSWTTVAGAGGTWVISFDPGALPGGEYDATITAVARDAAGNETTQTSTLRIDTVGEVAISGAMIEGDDVINADEASDGFTVTGTTQPGSTVVVTFEGVDYTATVAADGSWTLDLPASGIAGGTYDSVISVTATDRAGNVSTVTRTVTVDTEATITLDGNIAGDNVINATEQGQGVTLTGMTEPGSTALVTFAGTTVTATVAANGSWTATFPASAIPTGEHDGTVTVVATDRAGNTSSTSGQLDVDTLVNNLALEHPVAEDGWISGAEANAGVTLTGTVEPGSAVEVTLGNATVTATVDANGNWSADFAAADIPSGEQTLPISVKAIDAAGNTSMINDSVELDTLVNELSFSNTPVAGDNYINADEAAQGVTFTGRAEAGSQVEVSFRGTTHTVEADIHGQWSVDFLPNEVPAGEYQADVTAVVTDRAGNTASETTQVWVDTVAPDTPLVSAFTKGLTGVRGISTVMDEGTPVISEVTADGAAQEIDYTVTENPGFQEVDFDFNEPIPDGSHLVVTAKDGAGNQASTLFVLEENGTNAVDLTNGALSGFEIEAIDLNFAEDSQLTLTAEQLETLSNNSNELAIRGGSDDTVTITGANNTGESVDIAGETYDIYTLGDEGGTLYINDDINVVI